MGGKFKLKRKDVKPSLKDKGVDARSKEPLFCFKYLDMKTSLKGCDNSVFKDFVTRIQKLCSLTWKDINVSGRHQYGFEMIPIKQLKPTSLPSVITEDIKELAVFRYGGDNRPFVCLIMDCVIYPIFIEAKFGDIYDHGSK